MTRLEYLTLELIKITRR